RGWRPWGLDRLVRPRGRRSFWIWVSAASFLLAFILIHRSRVLSGFQIDGHYARGLFGLSERGSSEVGSLSANPRFTILRTFYGNMALLLCNDRALQAICR